MKVIVGGAPVIEAYAREIGADAYAFDAANAVERVKALVGRRLIPRLAAVPPRTQTEVRAAALRIAEADRSES